MALTNFTRNLAKELAPHIMVNAVAPGLVADTAFLDGATEKMNTTWLMESPLGSFLSPYEANEAFVILARSPVITGEVPVVDGGFNLKRV